MHLDLAADALRRAEGYYRANDYQNAMLSVWVAGSAMTIAAIDAASTDAASRRKRESIRSSMRAWKASLDLQRVEKRRAAVRAAKAPRRKGDATRNGVLEAWTKDVRAGNPVRGRVKRIHLDTGIPQSTVIDALDLLKVRG